MNNKVLIEFSLMLKTDTTSMQNNGQNDPRIKISNYESTASAILLRKSITFSNVESCHLYAAHKLPSSFRIAIAMSSF